MRRVVVFAELAGRPLDAVVSALAPTLSRRQARVLVELGGVRVHGVRAAADLVPAAGDALDLVLGGAVEACARGHFGHNQAPEVEPARSLRILHEDDDVCVVDKPAGLITEASPGSARPSVVSIVEARRGRRAWVVQRLDTATSGVLVLATSPEANRSLVAQLGDRTVGRAYVAVVQGATAWDRTTADAPLRGRRAITHLAVAERFAHLATRLTCVLETGRTHQIRLHCARLGHAVCGDPRHGTRTAWDPPRLALHARRLAFHHPRTGARLMFDSPVPGDLGAWLRSLAEIRDELERKA